MCRSCRDVLGMHSFCCSMGTVVLAFLCGGVGGGSGRESSRGRRGDACPWWFDADESLVFCPVSRISETAEVIDVKTRHGSVLGNAPPRSSTFSENAAETTDISMLSLVFFLTRKSFLLDVDGEGCGCEAEERDGLQRHISGPKEHSGARAILQLASAQVLTN